MDSSSQFVTIRLNDDTEVCDADEFNGHKFPTFPPDFSKRMTEIQSNFRSKPGDILIYGFMKSGTHWVWEITRMLLEKDPTISKSKTKFDGFVEMNASADLEALEEPRILSTHLMVNELPENIFASSNKVIVPIRHPKAVALSMYKHLSAETGGTNLRCGWDRFLSDVWFSKQHMLYYPWTDYTADMWRRCCENDNFHPIVYEQLLDDPYTIIQDLSNFLDLTDVLPELIQQIYESTRFDKMKQVKVKTEKFLEGTFESGYTMFRTGTKDDWKNHFTEEQSIMFDERMEEACRSDPYLKQAMMLFSD